MKGSKVLSTLIMIVVVVLAYLLIIIAFGIGCLPDRDECGIPGAMRCDDNMAQICSTDGVWMEDDDCDAVPQWDGPPAGWKCCMDDDTGDAVCVDVEVCR